jgi:uncharacterized membrane protein
MNVTETIQINGPSDAVWKTITDIDNCKNVISAIMNVDVLERPENGLVGLKWQETREMFGKEATETMWITDASADEFYATRAESHGSVYISKLSLSQDGEITNLTMSFTGEPQTFTAKLLSTLMAPMIKSSLKKALAKDLSDIKNFVEQHNSVH